ncbi:MAG: DUF5673 domain-containing protein [Tissierellia bacterium]|nr:DUF5673 domain-containing protein [Tissierellia bacterium]
MFKNTNGFNMNFMILIIYAVLAIMLLTRIVKGIKAKKELKGEVNEFQKKSSPFEFVLVIMLFVIGIFNFVQAPKTNMFYSIIIGVMMLVIAIFFLLNAKGKVRVAENAILADGQLVHYKQLKRWGFDKESGELVMLVKVDQREEQRVVRTKNEDINEINRLIRKYKLGK